MQTSESVTVQEFIWGNGTRTTVTTVVRRDPSQGDWIPACGGTEVPFTTRNGRRLQYLWQPSSGRHAYIDCATDTILSDAEALEAIGL